MGSDGPFCHLSPQQPRPRLFHASALLGDTMVVLGGRSDPDEFSSEVLLYQVNCNTWLLPDLTRKSFAVPGSPVWALPLAGSYLVPLRRSSTAPAPKHPGGALLPLFFLEIFTLLLLLGSVVGA